MRIGIIAEGHSDRAVIVNVISRITGLDESDFQPLLPQYKYDATDSAVARGEIHGGWPAVKNECENRVFIDEFLLQEGNEFICIHFDTAESSEYGILQPTKDEDYASKLRELIINQIGLWLGEDLDESLLHAIAIEEMDAWILTVMENRDSTKSANAKKKLEYLLKYKPGKLQPDYDLYFKLSKELKECNEKKFEQYLERNQSLKDFCREIMEKVVPRMQA